MRALRITMALLLIAVILSACSKVPTRETKGGDPVPPPSTANTVTTIRVFSFGGDSLDALISAYYDKHPNDRVEKVTPQMGGSTSLTDLMAERMERGEVDVISFVSPGMIKENKIAALDPFIQKANFDLKGLGDTVESLRYEGKLYELPYSVQPEVVVYNQEMFQTAGITPPTKSWTWDELRAAAQKLTQGEGDQKTWGFSPEFPDGVISAYLSQAGAEPLQVLQDENVVKDLYQLFGTMIQVDRSMPPSARRTMEDRGPISSRNDFQQGRAAMTITNASSLRWMQSGRDSFPIDVAPVPVRPGGKLVSRAYPETFAIAANSPNQEAAWRFLSFVSGPEGAAILAKAGSVPVYRSPEVRSAWFDRQPAPPPGTEFLFETTWDFGDRYGQTVSGRAVTGIQELYRGVYDNLNEIMAGEKGWEDGFADYQRMLKEWQAANQGG